MDISEIIAKLIMVFLLIKFWKPILIVILGLLALRAIVLHFKIILLCTAIGLTLFIVYKTIKYNRLSEEQKRLIKQEKELQRKLKEKRGQDLTKKRDIEIILSESQTQKLEETIKERENANKKVLKDIEALKERFIKEHNEFCESIDTKRIYSAYYCFTDVHNHVDNNYALEVHRSFKWDIRFLKAEYRKLSKELLFDQRKKTNKEFDEFLNQVINDFYTKYKFAPSYAIKK